MSSPDFKKNYFELFDMPQQFALDRAQLGLRFRQLQQELHPDRFAGRTDHEQRVAVQYSALVNEANATLTQPLSRALYLLQLKGMSAEEVARQQIDGGFLIEQLELREKLETMNDLVDPDTVLEHFMAEVTADIGAHQNEFVTAFDSGDLAAAASACVKMQYLDKLMKEAELIESSLLD
jgi:molecular chaperone HscB